MLELRVIEHPATFYAIFPPWYQQKKEIDCTEENA